MSLSIPFKEHYVTRAGSHSYGLATEASDLDLRGFFFPADPADALGFIASSATFNGLGDTTLWEVRRFFGLAAKGNPNVIETLFTEDEDVVSNTGLASRVRGNRDSFLSGRVVTAAIGFATSQRIKIEKKWDAKAASHALRLMWQTIRLCETGTLKVRQTGSDASVLVKIKQDLINQVDVKTMIAGSLAMLRKAEEKSPLPKDPDMKKLNDLCTELMREHIGG